MSRLRVLVLSDSCNPDWPSLPVVGYKYARALAGVADVTLATHVRNRENIEADGTFPAPIAYIDNEWIAAPLYRLSVWLRGGDEGNWSLKQMMEYPSYLAFERQVFTTFRKELEQGAFDIVHRLTPMSPTSPSYIAHRIRQPFVIGPLNGNLDWPKAFLSEQKREREMLRRFRNAYRYLPYVRSTFRNADAILASFQHTIDDLVHADPARIVPIPEIGFDPGMFRGAERAAPFSGPGPFQFLYAGRLVPYKVPEAVVRAFVTSDTLKAHRLRIVGDGPEQSRLEEIVDAHDARDRVAFTGRKTQAEVGEEMRQADAFVFPSIRELGAGVVIEAMASGAVCLVTDYGAPGDLAANGRGVRVPLQPLEGLVDGFRNAMENCIRDPAAHAAMADKARTYATTLFDWNAKARYTAEIYQAVLEKRPLNGFDAYV